MQKRLKVEKTESLCKCRKLFFFHFMAGLQLQSRRCKIDNSEAPVPDALDEATCSILPPTPTWDEVVGMSNKFRIMPPQNQPRSKKKFVRFQIREF